MPKTRAIVPLTHPTSGEPVAAGAELTLSDEDYAALRAAGSVEASAADQKASSTSEAQGNYSERTGREDVASTKTETSQVEPPREEKKK